MEGVGPHGGEPESSFAHCDFMFGFIYDNSSGFAALNADLEHCRV